MNRHPDQNAAFGICFGLFLGAAVWLALIIAGWIFYLIATLPAPLR